MIPKNILKDKISMYLIFLEKFKNLIKLNGKLLLWKNFGLKINPVK